MPSNKLEKHHQRPFGERVSIPRMQHHSDRAFRVKYDVPPPMQKRLRPHMSCSQDGCSQCYSPYSHTMKRFCGVHMHIMQVSYRETCTRVQLRGPVHVATSPSQFACVVFDAWCVSECFGRYVHRSLQFVLSSLSATIVVWKNRHDVRSGLAHLSGMLCTEASIRCGTNHDTAMSSEEEDG